jgi:sulfur-carrier protein
MRLEVRLFAGLKCGNPELSCCGESEFVLEVPSGITIKDLRGMLGIDPAITLLSMVNNHHEHENWVLKDNDRIGMFPPLGGG